MPGLWSTLREAVRGSQEDLTTVPLRRAVLLLATPVVLEMSMESLFAIVDIFYVSRLGSEAIATVGLTETMLSPVYALSIGLSAGATALISRRTGEKDPEGAAVAAGQVILVALVYAAVIGAAGALLAPTLLSAMGASASVLASGATYARTMLGGSVTIFLLFVFSAIFRSAGDAVIAMRSLWLANGLNIALAPVLIFGVGPIPAHGVLGAAIATTVSRGVGVLYQVSVLSRGPRRPRLPFERRHLGPRPRVMVRLVRLAWTATIQVLVETVSWLGLVRILSAFGSAAVAGYTIAMRVTTFVLLPALGLATSAATLVGQNLGANEPERARRSVSTIALYNTLFLLVIGATLAVAARSVLGVFTSDPSVLAYGADCLRIVAIGFVTFAYGMVTIQAFNGAGDPMTPLAINLGAFWGLRVPLAYVLAVLVDLGPRGVFLAITASYSAQAIAGGVLFRRGRWQRKKV
ncbi:MAG: MATE family efflux transporter [Labilithrix sp.]|nr:MATE family efflux transporter [Labilithrix sp.]MCW5831574.1 MATE family efflux transporter [Labilithrix sp.]